MNQTTKNERLKLIANAFNTIAVSFIVTGIVVPAIGAVYGSISHISQPAASVVWVVVAIRLHLLGLWILGGLK